MKGLSKHCQTAFPERTTLEDPGVTDGLDTLLIHGLGLHWAYDARFSWVIEDINSSHWFVSKGSWWFRGLGFMV